MPITIKDYTWEETEKVVYITVPLKGVKQSKADIFSTEEYLKVHFPPYLFECFLFAPVHDQQSAVQVGNGTVVFKLEKQEPGLWGQLQSSDAGDKEKMKERREAAIRHAQERAEQQQKEKAEQKREANKYSINQAIELDRAERQKIEDTKESERKQATEELEKWKAEQQRLAEEEKKKQLEEREAQEKARLAEIQARLAAQDISTEGEQGTESDTKSQTKKKGKKGNIFDEAAAGQPLRQPGKISVSFTERVFPTAARESQAAEEEAWLKKQAENRRVQEIEDSELSENEKDPVWLKDKGNSFYKSGNYQAAINVFSHAIRLNYKMPALYSNRAACHLHLGNYFKCIEDSTRALELLTPPVQQNAANRCRAHVRRGTAYCNLELYAEGLQDYEAAIKIDPSNEQIKMDAKKIRDVIQGTNTS